jgi:hypothetical protein
LEAFYQLFLYDRASQRFPQRRYLMSKKIYFHQKIMWNWRKTVKKRWKIAKGRLSSKSETSVRGRRRQEDIWRKRDQRFLFWEEKMLVPRQLRSAP